MKTRVAPSNVKAFVIKVHNNDRFEFEKILSEYVSNIYAAYNMPHGYSDCNLYLEERVNQNTYYTLLDLDSFTITAIITEMTKRCGKN